MLVGPDPLVEFNRARKLLRLIVAHPKKWERALKSEGCCGKVFYDTEMTTVLWLANVPRCPRTIGILAHEAMHAAVRVCDSLGMKFCDKSDEAYTYTTEFIVSSVLSRVGKR